MFVTEPAASSSSSSAASAALGASASFTSASAAGQKRKPASRAGSAPAAADAAAAASAEDAALTVPEELAGRELRVFRVIRNISFIHWIFSAWMLVAIAFNPKKRSLGVKFMCTNDAESVAASVCIAGHVQKTKLYKRTIMLKTLMALCTRFIGPDEWRMRVLRRLGIDIRPGNAEQFRQLDDVTVARRQLQRTAEFKKLKASRHNAARSHDGAHNKEAIGKGYGRGVALARAIVEQIEVGAESGAGASEAPLDRKMLKLLERAVIHTEMACAQKECRSKVKK